MNSVIAGLVFALAVLFAGGTAVVWAVGLDPHFGVGGKVVTTLGQSTIGRAAFLIQPNGKILVAATTVLNNSPRAVLVRYDDKGELDPSFGTNGKYIYSEVFGIPGFFLYGATQQPDGKIVIVGQMAGMFILRVNPNGSPDLTFGTNGYTYLFPDQYHRARSVLVQPSGRIVVGGMVDFGSLAKPLLVALNPNGTVDNSFGPDGNGATTPPHLGQITSLLQSPDGKLIGNLYEDGGGGMSMKVIRFTANGILDTTFAGTGVTNIPFNGYGTVEDLAIQPDGKIVAVGNAPTLIYGVGWTDFAVIRLNQDGSLDNSFGQGGKAQINFHAMREDAAHAVAIQPDGKIVVGGTVDALYQGTGDLCSVVARLNPNGSLAGKTDSVTTHDPDLFSGDVREIAIQPDGKVVTVGLIGHRLENGRWESDLSVVRYSDITSVNNSTIKFDFDGDRSSEVAVFRPSTGVWYGAYTGAYDYTQGGPVAFYPQWGQTGDSIVPGDYNGDGITEFAYFHPANGTWYSRTGSWRDPNLLISEQVTWGQAGDIPAPADYDGDGSLDRAVFRPSTGAWYVLKSTGGYTALTFGLNGDRPVPADYDGDGRADIAVVRQVGGQLYWYLLQSSNQAFVAIAFGAAGDKLVPTDYTADGRAEIAVFRPSNGYWYFLSNYSTFSASAWGLNGDVPSPADYDADGTTDLSVFRPSTGTFYTLNSRTNTLNATVFGLSTDIPVASAYVR